MYKNIKGENMTLSLDCSTTAIGWSVWNEDDLIEYGRLTPTVEKLEWRDRIRNFIPQINDLINKYKPIKIYAENVPMGGSGGNIVLSQLFCLQGTIMGLVYEKGIEIEYINVGTWRRDIGIGDGAKDRNSKKIRAIEKANELFNLELPCLFTKSGNYKPCGSDDIADSCLLYASTRNKYKIEHKQFGRR